MEVKFRGFVQAIIYKRIKDIKEILRKHLEENHQTDDAILHHKVETKEAEASPQIVQMCLNGMLYLVEIYYHYSTEKHRLRIFPIEKANNQCHVSHDVEIQPGLIQNLLKDDFYFYYDAHKGKLRMLKNSIESIPFRVNYCVLSFIKCLKKKVTDKKRNIKLDKQCVELCFAKESLSVEAHFLVSIACGNDSINRAHVYTYLKKKYHNPIYNIAVQSTYQKFIG